MFRWIFRRRPPEVRTRIEISRSDDALAPYLRKLLGARAEHVYIDKDENQSNKAYFVFSLDLPRDEVEELIATCVPKEVRGTIRVNGSPLDARDDHL